jgi:hypothetical protein
MVDSVVRGMTRGHSVQRTVDNQEDENFKSVANICIISNVYFLLCLSGFFWR